MTRQQYDRIPRRLWKKLYDLADAAGVLIKDLDRFDEVIFEPLIRMPLYVHETSAPAYSDIVLPTYRAVIARWRLKHVGR